MKTYKVPVQYRPVMSGFQAAPKPTTKTKRKLMQQEMNRIARRVQQCLAALRVAGGTDEKLHP